MWCCGGKESGRSCDDGIKNRTGVDRPDRAVIVHLVQKCWKCQSSSNFQILDKSDVGFVLGIATLGTPQLAVFWMFPFICEHQDTV